jgi:hypothetical protein
MQRATTALSSALGAVQQETCKEMVWLLLVLS